MSNPKQFNLIYFGDMWDESLRRRRQIAQRLAAKEAIGRVIFVEVIGLTLTSWLKYLLGRGDEHTRRRWPGLFRNGLMVSENGVFMLPIFSLLPTSRWEFLNSINRLLAYKFLFWRVRRLLDRQARTMLWVGYPYPTSLIGQFHEEILCYDSVDDHWRLNQFYWTRRMDSLEAWNEEFIRRSDIVFANSPSLYERAIKLNSNVHLAPNGVDMQPIRQYEAGDKSVPEDMRSIPRPIIGYVGGVFDERQAIDLVTYIARQRPEWSVVLICDMDFSTLSLEARGKNKELRVLPNVHFLGRKPYCELPAYIGHFDVGISVYKEGTINDTANSLKLLNYLAAGKPVVSTKTGGVGFYKGFVVTASTGEEFVARVEEALVSRDPTLVEGRQQLAEANSWEHRVNHIYALLKQAIERSNAS